MKWKTSSGMEMLFRLRSIIYGTASRLTWRYHQTQKDGRLLFPKKTTGNTSGGGTDRKIIQTVRRWSKWIEKIYIWITRLHVPCQKQWRNLLFPCLIYMGTLPRCIHLAHRQNRSYQKRESLLQNLLTLMWRTSILHRAGLHPILLASGGITKNRTVVFCTPLLCINLCWNV